MADLQLAGCIIANDTDGILLLHRNTKKRRQWEIPGGKLDPHESPLKAAVREVREETGLEVEIIRELGTQPFHEDGNTLTYTWFLAEIIDGAPQVQNPQTHDRYNYFTIGELNELHDELSPNVRNFLDQLTAGGVTL
jgi:8-oxo-dGTP diphosphatase